MEQKLLATESLEVGSNDSVSNSLGVYLAQLHSSAHAIPTSVKCLPGRVGLELPLQL